MDEKTSKPTSTDIKNTAIGRIALRHGRMIRRAKDKLEAYECGKASISNLSTSCEEYEMAIKLMVAEGKI